MHSAALAATGAPAADCRDSQGSEPVVPVAACGIMRVPMQVVVDVDPAMGEEVVSGALQRGSAALTQVIFWGCLGGWL